MLLCTASQTLDFLSTCPTLYRLRRHATSQQTCSFRSDGVSFPGGILSSTQRLYSLVRMIFDEADWLGGQLRSKQVDEVHLTASERVAYPRAGNVTLRPGACVDGAVVAPVNVVM